MAGLKEKQGQLVFGLDIGTRSIVGTVGYMDNGKFHVLAQQVREHETRAMLDGQIHNIGQVGKTIAQVKEQLEAELNRELREVCIAAAGRVLRTVTTHVDTSFDMEHEITQEDIYALSTLGVEHAYEEFVKGNDTEMKFYCVGYTPMRYYLNGYQIGNLEGHKAKQVGMDIIATFLPDDVVDGLYKAVEIAGLHVANLTLEPIAAIQVAIPEKFRMLNMGLVDVGAGTSDISITKEGTITAYGMIPVAGDSLTDILVQHCLVDFDTAEQIKRQAGVKDTVEYLDIMGLPQVITAGEVEELLREPVRDMASKVAESIKELNGDKPVSAVFVVGGGGMIPGYTQALSECLGIVKERVAIRGQEVMQQIIFENDNPIRDSLMVTPIGICLSYYEQSNNFIFVHFNGNRIKLYDNGKLTVADAAVSSEFPNEELFPRRGKALTFRVGGKTRILRGERGEAAVIRVNGEVADIYTRVHNGDHIEVTSSTAGSAAGLELGRLPELKDRLHVVVNGSRIDLPKTATVNGRLENEFYQIKEEDDIRVKNYYTVREIATFMDLPLAGTVLVNEVPAGEDTKIYENFTLSWKLEAGSTGSGEANFGSVSAGRGSGETQTGSGSAGSGSGGNQTDSGNLGTGAGAGNGSAGTGSGNLGTGAGNGSTGTGSEKPRAGEAEESPLSEFEEEGPVDIYVFANGASVRMTGKSHYIFVDIFNFIEFDLSASAGRNIVTKLNGRPAEYMEPIKEADKIDIYWEAN